MAHIQTRVHPALLLLKKVPRGKVTTYGILAKATHSSPRAIGQIMKRNRHPDIYPCYKVICSDGSIGGYAGKVKSKEIKRKIMLLKKNGVTIDNGQIDKRYFWVFEKDK
jgi:O-6-methylguanine DNA methyltransferase